jgi:putative peptide maturation system protein
MILIVSAVGDDHVAAVESELRRRAAAVLHLDLADLPAKAQLSVAYQSGRRARPVLRLRDEEFDLGTVTAVWVRHPRAPSPDALIKNQELRDYVSQETADAWIGASTLLDCTWLPGPHWQELRAGYKPLQLQVAADLGFEIPPTLVTNSPSDFLDFYRVHSGAVISKTVHNRLLPANRPKGYNAYVLTEFVASRDVVDVDAVKYCPVTVQPYVDKGAELRITVVGKQVFPVELDTQRTNHTRYDWRRGDYHRARFTIHNLPQDIERRCVELVERLGLRFGAIDLILTPDGRYVFLEINPNGEWLWMERTTGLPIAAAVSNLLVSGETVNSTTRVSPIPSQAAARRQVEESDAPVLVSRVAPMPRTDVRISQGAVLAMLKYLLRLARQAKPAAQAVAGLRRLAKRHPGTKMDLVWQVESSYFGTVQYDALVRMPGGGTISLAFSPKGAIPWALRHAHHAHETDLLRVNGRTLNMQTVMGYLDGLWHDARLLTKLVDGCLVREAVEVGGIKATDDEIGSSLAAFERKTGISSAGAKAAWLRGRGWAPHDLEYAIRRNVIAHKLREQVVDGKIDRYFAAHHAEFDTAIIARLRVAKHEVARAAPRIKQSKVGLGKAVEEAIMAGETDPARSGFATVRRRDFPPQHSKAIFAAEPGQVVGPLERVDGYDIVRVLRIVRARLDDPTRELITNVLFDEWLAKRRGQAAVEWFWGDAELAPYRAGGFT